MTTPCPFAERAEQDAKAKTKRFRKQCNDLIAAIEQVRDSYFTRHPDTPGSEVSRECAGHILHIIPHVYDVLDYLSDEGKEYGSEDTIMEACGFAVERQDAIEAVQDFIARTIPAWESDEQEERA